MWPFSPPPHQGDEHFDLGIWHPNALPAGQQNRDFYELLKHRFEEGSASEEREDFFESEGSVRAFHDEVTALVDALPDEDEVSRPWSIVFRCDPLFLLISLWPAVAAELAPAILESASRHGLVCYDPQKDVVSLPKG